MPCFLLGDGLSRSEQLGMVEGMLVLGEKFRSSGVCHMLSLLVGLGRFWLMGWCLHLRFRLILMRVARLSVRVVVF